MNSTQTETTPIFQLFTYEYQTQKRKIRYCPDAWNIVNAHGNVAELYLYNFDYINHNRNENYQYSEAQLAAYDFIGKIFAQI